MEKKLTRVKTNVYFYKNGKRIEGSPAYVWGDLSNVWGDLTGVSGDLTCVRGDLTGVRGNLACVRGNLANVSGDLAGVWGDLTGVSGNLTGVSGNLTDVRGDLSGCAITDEDRASGIDIIDLIDSVEPNTQALREAGDAVVEAAKVWRKGRTVCDSRSPSAALLRTIDDLIDAQKPDLLGTSKQALKDNTK